MIVTFCGHADFSSTRQMEERLLSLLSNIIGDSSAELYLSHYGAFDQFAHHCGKIYKRSHPHTDLLCITPYITDSYHKKYIFTRSCDYDGFIYPPIEHVPYKFAILHCNQWMVRQADFVIAYINHDWGGAYQTYRYAVKMGKSILNLGTFSP
ncbi:MAG: hypothetical protein IJY20_06525 [Clostridia bacterium]|nr:hypothetical protein [Clostridia bacterium]